MIDWSVAKDICSSFLQPLKNWLLKPEQREHDKKIFFSAGQFLNEDDVMTRLDELQSFGTFRSRLFSTEKFYRFFRLSSNQYRDRQLKKASMNVSCELEELLSFLANNFVARDCGEDKYAEKPEFYGGEHDQFVGKLDDKIAAFREAYRKYRELIKEKLNI